MKSTLMLIVLLCFSYSSDAQFDKIKKKLEERAKQKEQQDKPEETDQQKEADLLKEMFGRSEDLDLEERYTFNFQIDWLVENSNEEESSIIKQLLSEEGNYIGMETTAKEERNEGKQVSMVIDIDKNYMIIFNKEEMQAIVMTTNNIPETVAAEQEETKKISITKTGKTKKILTYHSEQYVYKTEDGKGEIWTTLELKKKNGNIFEFYQQMSKKKHSNKKQYGWYSDQAEGYLLETMGTSNEGETFHMVATAVDENADINIEVSEFKVMDMTKMGNFQNRE